MEYQGFLVPRPPPPLRSPASGVGIVPIVVGLAAAGTAAYFLFFRK